MGSAKLDWRALGLNVGLAALAAFAGALAAANQATKAVVIAACYAAIRAAAGAVVMILQARRGR